LLKNKLATCLMLMPGIAFAAVLFAQSAKSTRDGAYTHAQAEQGHALFTLQCATCHGAQLEGSGQNPPLKGQAFLNNWNGQTLADFYTQIQSTMPATKPGSLQPGEVSQLIAYILSANSYPAGTIELPDSADKLKEIQFDLPAQGAQ
jgi:mono/diheme cytochrome c family protein